MATLKPTHKEFIIKKLACMEKPVTWFPIKNYKDELYNDGEATRTKELVNAANRGPEIAPAVIDGICGTCSKQVA